VTTEKYEWSLVFNFRGSTETSIVKFFFVVQTVNVMMKYVSKLRAGRWKYSVVTCRDGVVTSRDANKHFKFDPPIQIRSSKTSWHWMLTVMRMTRFDTLVNTWTLKIIFVYPCTYDTYILHVYVYTYKCVYVYIYIFLYITRTSLVIQTGKPEWVWLGWSRPQIWFLP